MKYFLLKENAFVGSAAYIVVYKLVLYTPPAFFQGGAPFPKIFKPGFLPYLAKYIHELTILCKHKL